MSVAGLSGLLADDQHVLDAEVLAAIYETDFRLTAGGHRGLPLVLPARNGS